MKKALALFLLVALLPLHVSAQSVNEMDNDGSVIKKIIRYHKLTPDINTNLDKEEGQKEMHTLMIRISLMSDTLEDAEILIKHEALYRDKIILFINKQKKENLKTRRQKTQFKKTLKNILNTTLEDEMNKPIIIKRLLFTRMLID